MKILLACLMCLLLGAAQSFAIKGGPPYPIGTNIVGTYAGVLQGVFDPTNPGSSNSLGIFSLGIPKTGLSTGTFIMFTQGRTFTGTIQGAGDPNTAVFQGLLQATFNYTITFITTTAAGTQVVNTTSVTASVNGNVNATVQAPKQTFANSAALLRGDAVLNIDQGEVAPNGVPILTGILLLKVNGFKQSNTA